MSHRIDEGKFRDGTDIRPVLQRMADFYCQGCGTWTQHMPYSEDELELLAEGDEVVPACVRCREDFQCGECGYEINNRGDCLRPEGHDA